jgi:hypothetical protein
MVQVGAAIGLALVAADEEPVLLDDDLNVILAEAGKGDDDAVLVLAALLDVVAGIGALGTPDCIRRAGPGAGRIRRTTGTAA